MQYYLFSDGGSRGNPGPAAAGYLIFDEQKKLVELGSKYIGIETNNFAEYTALYEGLKIAQKLGIREVECNLDSELVVKQLNGVYKISSKNIKDLYLKIIDCKSNFTKISFKHILRESNRFADKLVNLTLDATESK